MFTLPPVFKGWRSRNFKFAVFSVLIGIAMVFFSRDAFAQASYTWNGAGGDNLMTDGTNWVGGSAPANPQVYLNFAGSTNTTVNNNFSAFSPGFQIYFNSG